MEQWDDILRTHGPLVWQTVWRLLRHEADAADAFQETFVSAVRVARRETVTNWPALLRHIATSRALDRLRSRRRAVDRLDRAAHQNMIDSGGEPSLHAEASELSERLRIALTQLPPQQAEVFCLRCLEEMTYDQIAARLDLSINHVGVLLNRARQRLRLLLDETRTTPPNEVAHEH